MGAGFEAFNWRTDGWQVLLALLRGPHSPHDPGRWNPLSPRGEAEERGRARGRDRESRGFTWKSQRVPQTVSLKLRQSHRDLSNGRPQRPPRHWRVVLGAQAAPNSAPNSAGRFYSVTMLNNHAQSRGTVPWTRRIGESGGPRSVAPSSTRKGGKPRKLDSTGKPVCFIDGVQRALNGTRWVSGVDGWPLRRRTWCCCWVLVLAGGSCWSEREWKRWSTPRDAITGAEGSKITTWSFYLSILRLKARGWLNKCPGIDSPSKVLRREKSHLAFQFLGQRQTSGQRQRPVTSSCSRTNTSSETFTTTQPPQEKQGKSQGRSTVSSLLDTLETLV